MAKSTRSRPLVRAPVFGAGDQVAINTLRFLAVDMVEAAKCGHPGAPMGQAPLAYLLFRHFRVGDPGAPAWPNRDRFVLSCGHASALLYGLLHCAGYDLALDELRRFRQLHSKTPGPPEYGLTPGGETTTGPLGQGLATAVGMAIAERALAARWNRSGLPLFDHRVWVLASDGDLMEGVGAEASSLAGHLGLAKLKVLYDQNGITIDGKTELAFTEDVAARYRAYGWRTLQVEDGNDLGALYGALALAAGETERPTLVLVRTHIGYGSPHKQDSEEAHGSPLGAAEARATKEAMGWPLEPTFHVPAETPAAFAPFGARGREAHAAWQELRQRYALSFPQEARELERAFARHLPADLARALPVFERGTSTATRKASGRVLNALAGALPELIGGSADLTGSNNTYLEGQGDFSRAGSGRNLRWGVREHAMGAAMNGLALSGLRPFGGTFLIFSDYLRPALRLSALMGLPVVWVFTHDSIFLGEDGPTHEPIEHLDALRAIPQLTVFRPADGVETAAAWAWIAERARGPALLALTRQKLPALERRAPFALADVWRGAYAVQDPGKDTRVVLLATGSEVPLACQAAAKLSADGLAARVVSMPCVELFLEQPAEYRRALIPADDVPVVAIELGRGESLRRFVGSRGLVYGLDRFGASAPYPALAEFFGFTPDRVAARVLEHVRGLDG